MQAHSNEKNLVGNTSKRIALGDTVGWQELKQMQAHSNEKTISKSESCLYGTWDEQILKDKDKLQESVRKLWDCK